MKLKTKNKSKTKLCCDCFLRSNVLFLAFTRVHSLIHAHNQIKPNQTKFNYRLRKRPVFLMFVFLWKMCSTMVFFISFYSFVLQILFVFFHHACLSSFWCVTLARSRFHKDSYKKLLFDCVCGVAFLRIFFIVLVCWFFSWVCVFVFVKLCVVAVSNRYYGTNFTDKFDLFFFLFFIKIRYDFFFLFCVCGCFV